MNVETNQLVKFKLKLGKPCGPQHVKYQMGLPEQSEQTNRHQGEKHDVDRFDLASLHLLK